MEEHIEISKSRAEKKVDKITELYRALVEGMR